MRRSAQARAQRSAGVGVGTDIPVPLPLRGLFSEARRGEVAGFFAGELLNWESTGAALRIRPPVAILSEPSAVLRRIPFEFGADPRYIEIYADRAECGDASITRAFSASCAVAYISGQAVIADGLGVPVRFDGSAFHEMTIAPSTDIDPARFDGVIAHHDRLYFWESGGDLDFYHSATVGGVSGTFTRFPLGRLGNITGSIAALASLTIDAGHGMNDTLAVMTTTGEIVAYEGLNPADPQDWRLLTRVKAAAPIGNEGFARIGSDLWMMTATGLVSIMDSIRQGVLALVGNVSRPIAQDIMDAVEGEGGRWQIHAAADGARIIVNQITDARSRQWVFHVEGQAWSNTDYPAAGFHNLGGRTQMTMRDGALAEMRGQANPNELITARWVSSWFRLPRATALRLLHPTIISAGPVTLRVVVLSDHDGTAADISQSEQIVTVEPDRPGARVALNERIACDAVGATFQLHIEVTAAWAEIVNLRARVT